LAHARVLKKPHTVACRSHTCHVGDASDSRQLTTPASVVTPTPASADSTGAGPASIGSTSTTGAGASSNPKKRAASSAPHTPASCTNGPTAPQPRDTATGTA